MFKQHSRQLATQASRAALAQAKLSAEEIDAVVVVTTSGFVTPSLAVAVALDLNLNPEAAQVPLVGYGCAGGVLGLARAAELVNAGYRNVLLVNVELCTLNALHGDDTKSNVVAIALFSDGASAAVISRDGPGPRVLHHHNTLLHDTENIMGWNTTDDGLQVIFDVAVPDVVLAHLPGSLERAFQTFGVTPDEIQHFLPHPGGVKVLNAINEVIAPHQVAPESWETLRTKGNMSSVSVMAVLHDAIENGKHGLSLLTAMGPGFNIGHLLVKL
ncbi:type III polyketide synthase [Deinococcus cavernae]|uniref:type III polyketide synthase n=1 Tax=Deinococcus cavernae TaxID=2320857 RepID=UPI002367C727|nr:3-oxoacyl-[acyl-carrier-protein] synthase III C-terminal domain-containing protein [Deinococcus cavernae]